MTTSRIQPSPSEDAGRGESMRLRVRRLCDDRRLIARARKQTRYRSTDLVTDAALLKRLISRFDEPGHLAEPRFHDEPDDVLAEAIAVETTSILRGYLVTALTETYGLTAIAANACASAEVPGREQQVAYCLVVLCMKDDPPRRSNEQSPRRTYSLDIHEPGFADALGAWANVVADNLRDSADAFEQIRAEDELREYPTLRTLALGDGQPPRTLADVYDTILDALSATLARGRRLEDMSLAAVLAEEPAKGEYVFQSPLRRWIRTTLRRRLPRSTVPLDEASDDKRPSADESHTAEEVYRRLVAFVAGLSDTRALLFEAIAAADDLQCRADGVGPMTTEATALFNRFRAELAAVTDELRAEQRAFGSMLAYILFALAAAPKRRRVAIISLRNAALAPDVLEAIACRIWMFVRAGDPPSSALLVKTAGARVPAGRAAELARLRTEDAYRAATCATLAAMLSTFPPTVVDLAAIAAAMPGGMTAHAVAVTRGQAADELGAVDLAFRRVFRRYAMGLS